MFGIYLGIRALSNPCDMCGASCQSVHRWYFKDEDAADWFLCNGCHADQKKDQGVDEDGYPILCDYED